MTAHNCQDGTLTVIIFQVRKVREKAYETHYYPSLSTITWILTTISLGYQPSKVKTEVGLKFQGAF